MGIHSQRDLLPLCCRLGRGAAALALPLTLRRRGVVSVEEEVEALQQSFPLEQLIGEVVKDILCKERGI